MKSSGRSNVRPLDTEQVSSLAPLDETSAIALVKIPVRCPRCSTDHICDFPEPVVVMALTRWNNMNLYAPCHEGHWSASHGELRAIREYLGAAWLESRLGTANPAQRLHSVS